MKIDQRANITTNSELGTTNKPCKARHRWILPPAVDPGLIKALAQELQLPLPIASLLIARGFSTAKKAADFLEPRLAHLNPPEEIPGMSTAVECLQQALQKKEKIILYGDYDVDGISSLALLYRFLRASGFSVDCFLPERAREGYGLSIAGLKRCFETYQPQLLIAVDCGTNSLAEAHFLQEQGIDLIVVDHHELSETATTNACVALVNPQLGSNYHYLCTVGLVFKLCHAFLKRFPNSNLDLRHYLDLVALGTVADIVPLVGDNRIFVRHGLHQLAVSKWPGVKALISVAEARAPYTGIDIGFKLGPRINAAGRLGSAQDALDLLLSENSTEASQIARRLDRLNRDRQEIERSVTCEAQEWVEANLDPSSCNSIVVGQRNWHEGVLGIVASRLARRWHRPTLVIGFNDEGHGKGSGRSIEGLPLVKALESCSHLLDAFGGHAMAAGMRVQEERLEELRILFEKTASNLLQAEDLIPRLHLQAEVDLACVDEAWLQAQECLAPFGPSNPEPLFLVRSVKPIKEPRLLREKHLRFDFMAGSRKSIAAIFFNGAMELLPLAPWDLAFTIERNTYLGRSEAQMKIVALRAATENK